MIALLESISHIAIAGIQLIDPEALAEMLVRFAFNFLFVLIIVRFFYYPRSKRRDYFFAFIMLSAKFFDVYFWPRNLPLFLSKTNAQASILSFPYFLFIPSAA